MSSASARGRNVELIRSAKQRGVRVTGEACTHHCCLTDASLRTYDSNYKMSPPLRTPKDVDAVLEGLRNGTLEVIATDHAPHSREKKTREFDQTPNGIIGLETLLPVCVVELIEKKRLSWPQLIEKLTINPAKVLSIDRQRGSLHTGKIADVTIIDPQAEWKIDVEQFQSKSRNCPWHGQTVRGRASAVLVGGIVKLNDGQLINA
ncbi:MAG TPA: amidohydrolase family protein [Gemmataceae bacterium]|nr:amidohydrolase family protein [Gemmataceae bacterium]